jgi:hypothetical protein
MTIRAGLASVLAVAGLVALGVAISHERRMHRYRKPGMSYADATFRVDGGWRKSDLFSDDGLRHQRSASLFGVSGAALLVLALVIWVVLALMGID